MPKTENVNDNLVVGRNAVMELLKSGREIENIIIAKGELEGSINKIVAVARRRALLLKQQTEKT